MHQGYPKNIFFKIFAAVVLAAAFALVVPGSVLADDKPDGASTGFAVRLEIRHAARVTDQIVSAATDASLPTGTQLVALSGGPDSAAPTVTYEAKAGGRVQCFKPRRVDHPVVGTLYQIPPQQPEVASVTWVLIFQ